MNIDAPTAVGIILTIIFLPNLIGALKESGRFKVPGRKPKTFRQFPTFPVQGEDHDND